MKGTVKVGQPVDMAKVYENPADFLSDAAAALLDFADADKYLESLDVPVRDEDGNYVPMAQRIREAIIRGVVDA